jgi:hypothetical protein
MLILRLIKIRPLVQRYYGREAHRQWQNTDLMTSQPYFRLKCGDAGAKYGVF